MDSHVDNWMRLFHSFVHSTYEFDTFHPSFHISTICYEWNCHLFPLSFFFISSRNHCVNSYHIYWEEFGVRFAYYLIIAVRRAQRTQRNQDVQKWNSLSPETISYISKTTFSPPRNLQYNAFVSQILTSAVPYRNNL